MPDTATINLLWADALLNGLLAAGVHRAVFSPGSRSTPLILALQRQPDIRTWHHPDERSAAFFALGLAKHDQQPVAVIATSGSAPAHWYPAVIEANRANIPLLLLSADRPQELQGCGANQTVDQSHMFGTQVRAFHDPGPAQPGAQAQTFIRALGIRATQQSLWPHPGPVHINLPFREPLVPLEMPATPLPGSPAPCAAPRLLPDTEQLARVRDILWYSPGLIVCGPMQGAPDFANAVTQLAEKLACPILADPLSQLRFGVHDQSHIACRYDTFLRSPPFSQNDQSEWVLRFGAAPVSKTLSEYLRNSEAQHLLCAPYGDWPDPLHTTREMIRAEPVELCKKLLQSDARPAAAHWLSEFTRTEQDTAALKPEPSANGQPLEHILIDALIEQLPANSTLFSGNSLPIRQLDSWSGCHNKPLRLLANRGASGIDGNISTLLALMAASEHLVVGLLGDLTFFHDMNGLLAAREQQGVIILLNNGGGGIFAQLPQRKLEQFEQHWLMPTELDFSQVAKLYGMGYQKVSQQSDFVPALQQAIDGKGVDLVEVMLDRELNLQR